MAEAPNPLDYESRLRRSSPSDKAAGLRARLARVSDNRWMVIVVLVGLTIQSVVFPLEFFHSYHLSVGSVSFCLVVATRDSDVFVARLWIPYAALAVLVLWAGIRHPRRGG